MPYKSLWIFFLRGFCSWASLLLPWFRTEPCSPLPESYPCRGNFGAGVVSGPMHSSNRTIRSVSSRCGFATRLSASARAIAISSLHRPAYSSNGGFRPSQGTGSTQPRSRRAGAAEAATAVADSIRAGTEPRADVLDITARKVISGACLVHTLLRHFDFILGLRRTNSPA